MANPEQTIADLQSANALLANQLMERELADVRAATEKRERERKEAEARADATRAAEQAAEAEKIRRGAWLTHYLDQQCSSGRGGEEFDIASASSRIPALGWPSGKQPSDYGLGQAAMNMPDDVSATSMFKEAQKRGVKF